MPNGDGEHLRGNSGVAIEKYIDVRIGEIQRAVDKAEGALADRLGGMNEIRETMRDQASKFVTREEMNLLIQPIKDSLKTVEKAKEIAQGKADQKSVNRANLIAGVAILLALLSAASEIFMALHIL